MLKNKFWRALLASAVVGGIQELIEFIGYKSFYPKLPQNDYGVTDRELISYEPFLKDYDLYWETSRIVGNYIDLFSTVLAVSMFILLCLFAFRDMTRKEIFKSSAALVVYSFIILIIAKWITWDFSAFYFPSYTVFSYSPETILTFPLSIFGQIVSWLYRRFDGVSYMDYILLEYSSILAPFLFAVFARHKKTAPQKETQAT